MGLIKLGTQKIECSDEQICDKINGYIAALEEKALKNAMGQPNSDSGFNLDSHLDGSYTADGYRYSNPHIAAHVAETDSAWKDTFKRADSESSSTREGRGLTTKYYY